MLGLIKGILRLADGHALFDVEHQLHDVLVLPVAVTSEREYAPNPAHREAYDELFALYRRVHDAFGGVETNGLGGVMKDLLALKDRQRAAVTS